MKMHFQQFDPHPLLMNYIEKIWVFDSNGPIPREDMKLIVPTGRIKLMVPFRNVSTVRFNGTITESKENIITLVGLTDVPFVIDPEAGNAAGTIGIEFNARGAYRFFRLNYQDIKNQMHPLSEVIGKMARQLEQQVCNTPSHSEKVRLLQEFLLRQYWTCQEDPIFDFCIGRIKNSKGKVTVRELEKQTGYSSRWLNMKFLERAGVSPKNLSAIVRFQEVYRSLTGTSQGSFDPRTVYDYYYDQSHFIKDFKRFTGMSPLKHEKLLNNFGRLYSRD